MIKINVALLALLALVGIPLITHAAAADEQTQVSTCLIRVTAAQRQIHELVGRDASAHEAVQEHAENCRALAKDWRQLSATATPENAQRRATIFARINQRASDAEELLRNARADEAQRLQRAAEDQRLRETAERLRPQDTIPTRAPAPGQQNSGVWSKFTATTKEHPILTTLAAITGLTATALLIDWAVRKEKSIIGQFIAQSTKKTLGLKTTATA